MDVNDFNKCKLTFILNKTRITTTQAPPLAYIVFTEITLSQNRRKIIISDNLEFSMSPSFQNESSAQHGFIVFDDFHKSCPLQSISSLNQPFHFEDDTQILYLQSTYDKIDFYRSSECNWRFTAPAKYGFKIVVETFNVSDLTWLTVINRTDVITNEIGLQTYHPYYNPDQWMQITLTKDHSDSIKRLEFQAYVTLVKKEFPNIDAKCSNVTTGYKTLWTMDQQMGYGKNVNCSYLLIVKPDTEIFVDVDKVVFEKGVDYIRYYPENLPRNYTTISSPTEFIVEPDENGKEKRFIWEFVSDGSIQSSGFEET
uniref:CUB domain-containing protein n=1 Tax=Panagrolaimus superbus TaxID=310955 RepID=A0A914YW05_9BILA